MRGKGAVRAAWRRVRRRGLKAAFGTAALTVAVGVPTAVAGADARFRADLSGDGDKELIIAQSAGTRVRIVIADTCGVKPRVHVASPVYDRIVEINALDVDGAPKQSELLFSLANGAGRDGLVRVVRLDRPKVQRPGRTSCDTLTTLFSYTTRRPPQRPPRGQVVAFSKVEVRELSRRYRGREIRLTEAWAPPNRLSRPSNWHYTFFRLDGTKYVSYGTSDIKGTR